MLVAEADAAFVIPPNPVGPSPGERRRILAQKEVATARQPTSRIELSPEQRSDMVRGMVERLAARLQRDGSDAEGWLRLVRAYVVLGQRDEAQSAAAAARRALAADPEKVRRIDALVKDLGLEG